MRRIIFFLYALLITSYCYSQNASPYKCLKLDEGGNLIFEQVYECDSLNSDEVKSMLSSYVPSISSFKDYQQDGKVITGTITAGMVDYKKYGGKWSNTAIFLNWPFSANVNFQWKDGRYKVTVTNITFHVNGANNNTELKSLLTRKRGSEWNNSSMAVQSGIYVEHYLFDILKAKRTDNW